MLPTQAEIQERLEQRNQPKVGKCWQRVFSLLGFFIGAFFIMSISSKSMPILLVAIIFGVGYIGKLIDEAEYNKKIARWAMRSSEPESISLVGKSEQKSTEPPPNRMRDAAIAFENGNRLWLEERDAAAAKCQFDLAIKLGLENSDLYCNRGLCNQALDLDLEAIQDLTKAIAIERDNCNLYYIRSISKGARKDFEGQMADLEQSIKVSAVDNRLNRAYDKWAKEQGYAGGMRDFLSFAIATSKMSALSRTKVVVLEPVAFPDPMNEDQDNFTTKLPNTALKQPSKDVLIDASLENIDDANVIRHGLPALLRETAPPEKFAEIYTTPIPGEMLGVSISIAQKFIAEGVHTPAALSRMLDEYSGSKAMRKYSVALWNAIRISVPQLEKDPRWGVVYELMDKATDGSQMAMQAGEPEQPCKLDPLEEARSRYLDSVNKSKKSKTLKEAITKLANGVDSADARIELYKEALLTHRPEIAREIVVKTANVARTLNS